MNRICTTIEQSKKLIELGIDVNTADMCYIQDLLAGGKYGDYKPYIGNVIPAYGQDKIRCWSLSALLELIPPYLGEFKDGIDFGFSKAMNGKWYSAHYIQLDNSGLATFTKTVTGDTAIDAAFNMVCWLKENGKI